MPDRRSKTDPKTAPCVTALRAAMAIAGKTTVPVPGSTDGMVSVSSGTITAQSPDRTVGISVPGPGLPDGEFSAVALLDAASRPGKLVVQTGTDGTRLRVGSWSRKDVVAPGPRGVAVPPGEPVSGPSSLVHWVGLAGTVVPEIVALGTVPGSGSAAGTGTAAVVSGQPRDPLFFGAAGLGAATSAARALGGEPEPVWFRDSSGIRAVGYRVGEALVWVRCRIGSDPWSGIAAEDPMTWTRVARETLDQALRAVVSVSKDADVVPGPAESEIRASTGPLSVVVRGMPNVFGSRIRIQAATVLQFLDQTTGPVSVGIRLRNGRPHGITVLSGPSADDRLLLPWRA